MPIERSTKYCLDLFTRNKIMLYDTLMIIFDGIVQPLPYKLQLSSEV